MKDVKRKQDRARKGGREKEKKRERKEGGKKGVVGMGKGVGEEGGREGRREKKRENLPQPHSDIEQQDPNYQQDRTPWTQGFALKWYCHVNNLSLSNK